MYPMKKLQAPSKPEKPTIDYTFLPIVPKRGLHDRPKRRPYRGPLVQASLRNLSKVTSLATHVKL